MRSRNDAELSDLICDEEPPVSGPLYVTTALAAFWLPASESAPGGGTWVQLRAGGQHNSGE